MKYILAISVALLFSFSGFSQWNTSGNNFTTGNLGVGTTNTLTPLFVVGEYWRDQIPKVLAVADPSNLSKTISLGYDYNYDAGVLASVHQSTVGKTL